MKVRQWCQYGRKGKGKSKGGGGWLLGLGELEMRETKVSYGGEKGD